jgi:hypothetical protein
MDPHVYSNRFVKSIVTETRPDPSEIGPDRSSEWSFIVVKGQHVRVGGESAKVEGSFFCLVTSQIPSCC